MFTLNKISESKFESLKQPQPLKFNPLEKSQSLQKNFQLFLKISQHPLKFHNYLQNFPMPLENFSTFPISKPLEKISTPPEKFSILPKKISTPPPP